MGRRRGEKRGKGQDGRRSRARESGTDGMVRSDGGEERCREGRDAARDEWKERRCGEVISTPNQPTSTHIASDSEQYKKKSEARFRTSLIRLVRNQTRIPGNMLCLRN